MWFYNFPKKQDLYLVHTSQEVCLSELFQYLYIQVSPKNSIFFRFLKTKAGFLLRKQYKQNIKVPNENSEYIGLVKTHKTILIELQNNIPFKVWHKITNKQWIGSKFLGLPMLSEYTLAEFELKKQVLITALSIHWKNVNDDPLNIHGDLTHFNILIQFDGTINFIDSKSYNHSKIFDFFYFYSYLRQCLIRCTTLKESHRIVIINSLGDIIYKVCKYKTKLFFEQDIKDISIPNNLALIDSSASLQEFLKIFIERDE